MEEAFSYEVLEKRVAESELGREWMNDPLMNQDVWKLTELGYNEEDCRMNGQRNIYFDKFNLPWLKLLAKLTTKAGVRERHSICRIRMRVNRLKDLDRFLQNSGYTNYQSLTGSLVQQFISEANSQHRQSTLSYAIKLWAEEQWLKITFIRQKYQSSTPKIETIPEEVLYQIYENFDLFPPPLERLFRLQIVLGCRIGEVLKIPRNCLKQENEQWFLLRWRGKRKQWQFQPIHPLVAEMVQEQQRFINNQFGCDSTFDKLFCQISTSTMNGAASGGRFQVEPIYMPNLFTLRAISHWLESFRDAADLRDKQGNRFELKSHQFRRTKASIMAYCEAEDEYIAAVLGHSSLDMLPHYRQRSLERLEKEAQTKGYVDMYGEVTTFKPRKGRYERLGELLKVSTPLGECHRSTMLGDCQYRYACLNCRHHRVTLEDKPKLEADIQELKQDLKKAQSAKQERRVTEIQRLLELLENRLKGLMKLQNIMEKNKNG